MAFFPLLMGFAGMLGILSGILVSAGAQEELQGLRRPFILLRDVLFLVAVGLSTMTAGWLAAALSMLLAGLVALKLRENPGVLVPLGFVILLIFAPIAQKPLVAGIFLLAGVVEGGLWAGEREKLLAKGLLRKELWQAAWRDLALYVALPFGILVMAL
jgi:hypothetical protein